MEVVIRPTIFRNSEDLFQYNNNSFCRKNCLKKFVDGKLTCQCGVLDIHIHEWNWRNDDLISVRISHDCTEVLFHPIYSSGTAAVMGNKPFSRNCHYYWEIRMLSKIYGTDVMVGVGTSNVNFSIWKHEFVSLLGLDSQSWGYSFRGCIQHNNQRREYGATYSLGSIIGLHLDMYQGTLEFYLNRQPLGIAFTDLKNIELYPMVSSTAARSTIRTLCCLSQESNLQMLCLKEIMKHSNLYEQYRCIPGLIKIYDKKYFWIVPRLAEKDESEKLALLDSYVTLSMVNSRHIHQPINFYNDESDIFGDIL